MTAIYHKEYPADRAAMQVMRAELHLHPAFEFGPEARPVYDELIARTIAAQDVTYEAGTVGGVPGWWCRPWDAVEGAAILYLHGGAYILGSASAYRSFAGQIAAKAKAVIRRRTIDTAAYGLTWHCSPFSEHLSSNIHAYRLSGHRRQSVLSYLRLNRLCWPALRERATITSEEATTDAKVYPHRSPANDTPLLTYKRNFINELHLIPP
jgi:hypothetical protein